MKIKAFILILFAGGFLLNACQKDIDIFTPNPGQLNGPDSSWQSTITTGSPVSILKAGLMLEPYVDSITVNGSVASIVTPSGIEINFPANCCATAAGQPVTGKVQVEIQVVKKKGDMIRLDKPSTHNDTLLVTAGEIFIRLKKDGQALQLAPGVRFHIRYVDLPTNPQMSFFAGEETNPAGFNWLYNPDTANNSVFIGTQSYDIYTNRLRWISLAYMFSVNNTNSVTVTADIASYFTNANTIAFAVLKDFRSVAAMRADFSTRKFISGKLPVGKPCTVVVISKLGDDYYLGHESAVTQLPASGATTQKVLVVPVKKSLPEILSYLSTL